MKLKRFTYTKDSGDISDREAVIISEPCKNYLTIDLSLLSDVDRDLVLTTLSKIDEFKDEQMSQISHLINWRTFKPEGIEWV